MKLFRTHFGAAQWSIFSILNLAYILVYFQRMAPAVMSADLMTAFQTSGAMLGSLAAIYFYSYALMQIPAGALVDFWGIRKTIAVGNLIAGAGSILFGLAPVLWVAGLGRFAVGLGVSVVFVGIMKSNSVWFSERRYGILSGLTIFFGNLGSLMAAGPLAALLNVMSWRMVFILIGWISILLSGIGFYIVRNRPEEYGHPPIVPSTGKIAVRRAREGVKQLLQVIGNRRLWISFVLNFASSGGAYAFMGLWAIPYLRDVHGLDRHEGALFVTLMIIGFAVGSLFWGWLSDYLRNRKGVLIVSLVLYNLTWIGLLMLDQLGSWGSALLFLAFGATGCGFILTMTNAKELCHPDYAGMAVATVNAGSFLGVAVIQPLFGRILDARWENTLNAGVRVYTSAAYQQAFYWMLVMGMVALLAAFFLKETHGKNIFAQSQGSLGAEGFPETEGCK